MISEQRVELIPPKERRESYIDNSFFLRGLIIGFACMHAAAILVLGMFIGSTLWWFILSSSVSVFRTKFSPHRLRWVNRISGIAITGFGLIALLSLRG